MRTFIDIIAEAMDVERLKKSLPWLPTLTQLEAATQLASAFYEAGHEDQYSFDQFVSDVDRHREQIANDNALDDVAALTEPMLLLLYSYGEAADWHALSPGGYRTWANS
jgi:hypothetical protein